MLARIDQDDTLPLDQVVHGECLSVMRSFPDNSVHSICCDPPAGISFMNREFDSNRGGRDKWIQWLSNIMKEALRVLRPGGHCLVWSLPRTSHWTGLALEQAGFEMRDCLYHTQAQDSAMAAFEASLTETQRDALARLVDSQEAPSSFMHIFGQGFPKSMSLRGIGHPELGSALKPAFEGWFHARKPFTRLGYCDIINQQIKELEADLCKYLVENAGKCSTYTQVNSPKVKANIVHENVLIRTGEKQEAKTVTGEEGDLLPVTDMSELELVTTTCLNIVTSWKIILEEFFQQMNRCTTGTTNEMITDLKILNCLLSQITPRYMHHSVINPNGSQSLVWDVTSLLNVVQVKWNFIQTSSVLKPASGQASSSKIRENASHTVENEAMEELSSNLRPACENWWLCRKPLSEKTLALNVLKWHCGGLNIDKSRVGTGDDRANGGLRKVPTIFAANVQVERPVGGRFPSNVLFSHSLFCTDTVCDASCPVLALEQQSGVRKSGGKAGKFYDVKDGREYEGSSFKLTGEHQTMSISDTGTASRFFHCFTPDVPFLYCAKSSRSERNMGCEGLEPAQTFDKNTSKRIAHINHETGDTTYNDYTPSSNQNTHPTVKPQSLLRYLISMITPDNGIVLDMFFGSGSTGVAAIAEGYHFIGIEALDTSQEPYCTIARARIAHAMRGVS